MGLNRIWIIVIFALAVGGCSRFKLLYSFSGEAIESEVGYFLDLNEDEQTALEAKVVDLGLLNMESAGLDHAESSHHVGVIEGARA